MRMPVVGQEACTFLLPRTLYCYEMLLYLFTWHICGTESAPVIIMRLDCTMYMILLAKYFARVYSVLRWSKIFCRSHVLHVQASTNTLLSHFVSMLSCLWIIRVVGRNSTTPTTGLVSAAA